MLLNSNTVSNSDSIQFVYLETRIFSNWYDSRLPITNLLSYILTSDRNWMPQGDRRLAAIMFTDMVGYTALGQRNESLSLALVEEQRKLIRSILPKHNGMEINTMGDGFLVEFPSALDAVRCAYDIQRATREFNFSLSSEQRLHLRIGIHVGDVLKSNGDISGDAVNVASRIVSLAEDGGVCLTRQIYDNVQNKFELELTNLGTKILKNVDAPTEVYKVVMPWHERKTSLPEQLDRKRIAVLPFSNISPNPEDNYFADGMTDELISKISKIREMRVIARTSAMKYKGSRKGVGEIGRELRVGSLLEGTVRKVGNTVRITSQLIDSQSEETLWSESYDRELQDIFAIQNDISHRVVEALRIQMRVVEEKDVEKSATGSTEAYTLYLKGRYYWNERTKEALEKAVKYFEKATEVDPRYALAFAGLADCYVIYGDYDWMKPVDAFPKARQYALKAIEIDSRLAEPHVSLGAVYNSYEGLLTKSEEEFKKAIELKPSYSTAHMWYGLLLNAMLRFEEGYKQIEQAGEFDPMSRLTALNLGWMLMYMGKPEEAINKLRNTVDDNPEWATAHIGLGWALLLDSEIDEAILELKNGLALSKGDHHLKPEIASGLAFAGRREEATRIYGELTDPYNEVWIADIRIAEILFALDRFDEAFTRLDRSLEERAVFINHGSILLDLRALPWFAEARKDPRWKVFLNRLGIRDQ